MNVIRTAHQQPAVAIRSQTVRAANTIMILIAA
jgi:hypothetical protein